MIYRDDHVLVLNKPHGMPVQGGPGITHHLDGLLDALRFGSPDRPRLVHRLDRDTSGVLLLAPHAGHRGEARRRVPHPRGGEDLLGGRRRAGRSRRRAASTCRCGASAARAASAPRSPSATTRTAARAITDYRTLDHAGQKLAWLELRPLTGRTHQLRVHCVAIGAPILGDVKYARPDQNNAFAATVDGLSSELHLHARALRLPHPAGGTLLVEADLPPHMTQTFRTLGFHAPRGTPARAALSRRRRDGRRSAWRALPRLLRIGLWSLAGLVGAGRRRRGVVLAPASIPTA